MLFMQFWACICTFVHSQTSTRNYVFICLIAFRKKNLKKIEQRELNTLLFSAPFKKLECVHLLATELLLRDSSEWAHLSWGPHTHFLFIVPHVARFLPQNQCLLVSSVEALQDICLSRPLIKSLLLKMGRLGFFFFFLQILHVYSELHSLL